MSFVNQYSSIIKQYHMESIQYTISTTFHKMLLSLKSALDLKSKENDVLIKPNILFITVSGMNSRVLEEYIKRNTVGEEFPSFNPNTSRKRKFYSRPARSHSQQGVQEDPATDDYDERDGPNSKLSFFSFDQKTGSNNQLNNVVIDSNPDKEEERNSTTKETNNDEESSSSIVSRIQSGNEIDHLVNKLNISQSFDSSVSQEMIRLRINSTLSQSQYYNLNRSTYVLSVGADV